MLIQRLGSETQKKDEFINELLAEIEKYPECCDEVWLASDYGFPKTETHRKSAGKLMQVAERFRKIGVRVSLQISNTIGHGEYMSSRDCSGLVYEGSLVEHMVGPDGTAADYCFCWNGENFRKYVADMVREYSKIKPHCVWFDDDLRAPNHHPVDYGCFCDNCIKKFNHKYSSDFTREKLVYEINFGCLEWREKYIEFLRESFGEFTYLISKAVNDVSPESFVGYQYCANGSYTGYGYDFIFDAMRRATGKMPKSRPGGGAYNDHNPNDFIEKMLFLDWQNSMLPEYVTEKCPEIENLPDVVYGKSIAGTCFETSLYLARGNTSMSYAMLMNDYEPMSWHSEMLKNFSLHRMYWEKLIDSNRDTCQAGLQIVLSREMWRTKLNEGESVFSWSKEPYERGTELLCTGIPIAYDSKSPKVFILHHENAKKLSDGEIEFLLTQPLVTDGATLALLTEKGYSFSARAKAISTIKLYETFTDHEINRGMENKKWSQAFHFRSGYSLTDINGETEVFSKYSSDAVDIEKSDGEYPFGIAGAVVKTEKGAKWTVFGHDPWNRIISANKRSQIINAAEYISGKPLAAIIVSPLKAIVLPRENPDGFVSSVSVVNCSIGNSWETVIRIYRPASEKFVFMSQNTKRTEIQFKKVGQEYFVNVPNIEPWSVGTVFCE